MFKICFCVCFCELFFVVFVTGVRQNLMQSPCPGIFQYFYDDSGVLCGNVQVNTFNDTFIQLTLQLSVGNNVEGYNGNIELAKTKDEVIQDLINRMPIKYKIYFPIWNRIPPKITKIMVNGEIVCTGPKIDINLVPVLTTINLQHTLKVNVPNSNLFNNNNNEHNIDALHPNARKDENKNPYYGHYHYSVTTPKIKSVQPQAIKFNPKSPNPRNPFFKNLTTTTKPPDFSSSTTTIRPILINYIPRGEQKDEELSTRTKNPVLQFPQENDVDDSLTNLELDLTKVPFDDICGRSITTNHLVANGSPVVRGAHPWLAALFVTKNLGPEYRCTGSLITKKSIVTAGHCLKEGNKKLHPDDVLVILGKLNIKKWTRDDYERLVYADFIHVHPDYQPLTADADIGIIILKEEIDFSIYIRPVCLWSETEDLNRVVGEKGVVVGWGRSETGLIVTSEPKLTLLPIVSQEQCLRSMYTFHYITSERTFCAGFRNGSGPCNGDSGGGFFLKRNGRWTLKGVVSMSLSDQINRNCDLTNYVVFVDASKFTRWILSVIK